ncbi:MAG TPA: TIGR00266 family protein [Geobacterales bacterium]|nr:TIGR00266 family protein [Geobacterales bacterium]
MKWEKLFSPTYTILKIELEAGEQITSEAGAFVYGKGDYEIKTSTGGIGKGLLRAIAGGESLFLNTYIARNKTEIGLAPDLPGDVEKIEINGEVFVQDSSYLAHIGDIEVTVGWRGIKGLFAEPFSGLVWLKLKGKGTAWLDAYGAIMPIDLKSGEVITVDNAHFVAMDASMKWSVRKFGGLKSFFFGGEGFVVDIYGPGRLYIQTRNFSGLIDIIKNSIRGR